MQYQYSAPYAGIYRGMGIVAANGVSTLPKYCLLISGLLLLTAIIMNLIRVSLPLRLYCWCLLSHRILTSSSSSSSLWRCLMLPAVALAAAVAAAAACGSA